MNQFWHSFGTSVLTFASVAMFLSTPAHAQQLFVGIESGGVPTRSTDLTGWPNVTYVDGFNFELSAAAATPTGELFLCEGAFTTRLYTAELGGSPQLLSTISVDIHGLAYGRGTLWGFSNFATPKGIYQIEAATGQATLAHDVHTDTGFRFFALDYNPDDDLLYGYTEFGTTGLYSIDIDTGELTFVVGAIPASNAQGRGLAIGNNVAYLTATRGDDGIPSYAYDLGQGSGGTWVPFTNAYPNFHSTGGAAWIPDQTVNIEYGSVETEGSDLFIQSVPNPFGQSTVISFALSESQEVSLQVYDSHGRHVSSLIDGATRSSGLNTVIWNGENLSGEVVSPGVYFYRLAVGRETYSGRVTLAR